MKFDLALRLCLGTILLGNKKKVLRLKIFLEIQDFQAQDPEKIGKNPLIIYHSYHQIHLKK